MGTLRLLESAQPQAPDTDTRSIGEAHRRSPLEMPDSYASTAFADLLDRSYHAWLGRWTGGLSPAGLSRAYFDWASHLALSPGKRFQLQHKAAKKMLRYMRFLGASTLDPESYHSAIEPLPQDKRFRGEAWQSAPFNLLANAFLLQQQWWHNATTGVPGVSKHNERIVSFATRQVLDIFSPANVPFLNPEVIKAAADEGGQNFVRGARNFMDDFESLFQGQPNNRTTKYQPGENVAITQGSVIYANDLMELIHYKPAHKHVTAEPVLIVPAWIMKYYILDLEPDTSMVRYLVDQGHDVYIISWKNPGPGERDVGFEDYMKLGVLAALNEVGADQVHAAGYCLGGTLMAAVAAWMAREQDDRLASLTLLAGQVDFSEAGELTLFIGESQVSFLEDIMWEQGYLDAGQMAGAFQLLRSNDLIWSRLVRDYLMGDRSAPNALIAWNADSTRMPYKMHSEYLRGFFLENRLSAGKFLIDDRPVSLSDIRVPIFALGTEYDHVAPWRSVYKLHLFSDTDVTFALASGGHNGGVVAHLGRDDCYHRILTTAALAQYRGPDRWTDEADLIQGSWWPSWSDWLKNNSSGTRPALKMEKGLAPAPGTYVHER